MITNRKTIGLWLLLALLPTIASAQQPTGRARGWAWALLGAIGLEQSDTPAPSPTPTPGGKCDNCNGTGKVGDGRVSTTCRECNGTGVINATPTPEPQRPAAKRGTIVMFCRPGCVYCDKWVALVKPKLIETWTIDEKKDPEGPVPHFEIRTGSRVIIHQGYLSIEQLDQIVGGK